MTTMPEEVGTMTEPVELAELADVAKETGWRLDFMDASSNYGVQRWERRAIEVSVFWSSGQVWRVAVQAMTREGVATVLDRKDTDQQGDLLGLARELLRQRA